MADVILGLLKGPRAGTALMRAVVIDTLTRRGPALIEVT
jgi:hypothetical protein